MIYIFFTRTQINFVVHIYFMKRWHQFLHKNYQYEYGRTYLKANFRKNTMTSNFRRLNSFSFINFINGEKAITRKQ